MSAVTQNPLEHVDPLHRTELPDYPTRRRPLVGFEVVEALLRDREHLAEHVASGVIGVDLVKTLVLIIVVCAASLGAALGLFRGGEQVLYATIKLPLVLLLTVGLCAPILTSVRRVLTGAADLRRDLAVMLSGLALSSVAVAALTPLVLLAVVGDTEYHTVVLTAVGCCAVGGGLGSHFAARILGRLFGGRLSASAFRGRFLTSAIVLVSCALVGSQLAWTLRPWIVRPRTEEVPFVRDIEGSFVEAVSTSVLSARGIYSRDSAPVPNMPSSVPGASSEEF